MKLLKEINKKESGQALILVLILLLVGGLIIGPLMGFMGTGLIAGQVFEEKMDEVFAADAGIEDAIWKILNGDFEDLDEGDDPLEYTLMTDINGLSVIITVAKRYLIQGIIGEGEYPQGASPNSDWMTFDPPVAESNPGEGWVEYTCVITIAYFPTQGQGQQPRQLESVGAFFAPFPGDDMIGPASPYDVTPDEAITLDYLESTETKIASGGFAFIWRWEKNNGPIFYPEDTGTLTFTFKINDPDWSYSIYFVWSTYKQQDIAYVTSGELWKWLIEATADSTTVRAGVIVNEVADTADILTWEIDPPE